MAFSWVPFRDFATGSLIFISATRVPRSEAPSAAKAVASRLPKNHFAFRFVL